MGARPIAVMDPLRFGPLDDARSRDDGGSGLGLAIVAEIVRAHGGAVRVDTAPSGGTRLRVELPVRIDRTVAAALLQQARASGYAGVIATDQGRLLIAGVLRHTVAR